MVLYRFFAMLHSAVYLRVRVHSCCWASSGVCLAALCSRVRTLKYGFTMEMDSGRPKRGWQRTEGYDISAVCFKGNICYALVVPDFILSVRSMLQLLSGRSMLFYMLHERGGSVHARLRLCILWQLQNAHAAIIYVPCVFFCVLLSEPDDFKGSRSHLQAPPTPHVWLHRCGDCVWCCVDPP